MRRMIGNLAFGVAVALAGAASADTSGSKR